MDINKLKSVGINYDSGLARFAGKKELYEKYLNKFVDDQSFNDLNKYLEANDIENAFKAAHTLKGIVGNLSMDNLYNATCLLVEDLRVGKTDNLDTLFSPVKDEYEKVLNVLK